MTKANLSAAISYYEKGNFPKALAESLDAIHRTPMWHEPYYLAAVCHQNLREYTQAMGFYMTALSLQPNVAAINYHAAKCLKDAGCIEAATPLYLKALHLQPDLHDAKYSLGLLQLLEGNWLKGWKGYALRGLGSDRAKTEKVTDTGDLIRWGGEEAPVGSTLLVTCEQGMGDALMVFRFARLLREKFSHISFTVHAPLVSLCQANVPQGIEVVPWANGPVDLSRFTHTIALMDLPGAFATTPDNVPNKVYLAAPKRASSALSETLGVLDNTRKFKVGVVWQTGKLSTVNWRDVDFKLILPLLQDAQINQNVQWVSLQKDIKVDGLPSLINAMIPVQDFADTATLIDKLDLVISVDTAVAHLAGAMGKPVWLLNRFESDWRWMRNQTTTPWYPSMQIFNEHQPGQWASVVVQVAQKLVRELG